MKQQDYDRESIREYLLDENSKIKAEIDEKLSSDPDLKYEINTQKILLAGIESAFDGELKARLQREDSKDRHFFRYASMIAASIALFIVAGYLFFNKTNEAALYDEYYKPYYNVVNDQRRALDESAFSKDAFKLYEQRNYKESIVLFEKALETDPDAAAVILYYGLSLMEENQTKKAIEVLSTLKPSSFYYEPGRWYLGLAYLKDGRTVQAKRIFEEISKSESAYDTRVKEILNRLD